MKFDIVSVGTATVDVVARLASGGVKNRLPKNSQQYFPLGAKIEMSDFSISSGGGATNTAVTFSRMGLKTAAVFEVGVDVLGDSVIRELSDEGVTSFPSRNKKLPTAGSVILVDQSGERTVLVHRGAANDLTLKEIPLSRIDASWMYIVPGGISYRTIVSLIRHAKKSGMKIALNPSDFFIRQGLKQIRAVIGEADMLLVNQEESFRITGVSGSKPLAVFAQLDKLVKGILVVTNGNKGVRVFDGKRIWVAGTFKNKKVVDRLGAGDAFGSGFVAGLMRMGEYCAKGTCNPRAIEYAIRLGSANATAVVEALGAKAGILTREQFRSSKRWQNLKITVKNIG